jgi:hypothetical protein
MKVIITIILLLLLGVGIFLVSNLDKKPMKEKYYYGPVQEGYNETLFRETGKYEKGVKDGKRK